MPANTRRQRGTRIKKGLDDLVNLDAALAVVPQREDEAGGMSGGKRPRTPGDEGEVHSSSTPFTSLSLATMVFDDDWTDWEATKSAIFFQAATRKDVTKPSGFSAREVDESKIAEALDTMKVWLARQRDDVRVPAYVEATRLVVEAQRQDRMASRQQVNDPSSQECSGIDTVRGGYCYAISRAVHVMTGSLISSKSFVSETTTYRARAQEIGFPEEAVEVRQRIAHGTEPTLSEVRWVSQLILQHLFHHYWTAQAAHVEALRREVAEASRKKQAKAQRKAKSSNNAVVSPTSLDDMERLLESADAEMLANEEDEEVDERDNRCSSDDDVTCIGGWEVV